MRPRRRPGERPTGALPGRPRLIACDLDGTLLSPSHALSHRARIVLNRLQALAVPVVVVTGRAAGAWLPTARRLRLSNPAVCAHGAMVVDRRGRVRAHWPIPQVQLSAALARLRAAVPDAVAGVERGAELHHEAGFVRAAGALTRPTRMIDQHRLAERPASKLLIRATPGSTAGWPAAASAAIRPYVDVVDSGVADLVEAVAAGVTKATGLAWLASRLGVRAADVVAFGDMPTDIPMLRWAGHGVAVANCHPAVLAVADAVTASCADDGVAAYLEHLLDRSGRS